VQGVESEVRMKLTAGWIHEHKTVRGSWKRAQLEILGMAWPAKRGWIARVVGREISAEQAERFISFGGAEARNRTIRGPNFVDVGCGCDVPPWERCKHSDR
jgi:hypothetical protein